MHVSSSSIARWDVGDPQKGAPIFQKTYFSKLSTFLINIYIGKVFMRPVFIGSICILLLAQPMDLSKGLFL